MVSHALMESCFICFTDYMVSHAFMVFFISFRDKNHGWIRITDGELYAFIIDH